MTLVDCVKVPIEEVLRDTDPERVNDGEPEKLGEVDSDDEAEELEQREVERVGGRVSKELLENEADAENVIDTVGDTLCEGDKDILELALGD